MYVEVGFKGCVLICLCVCNWFDYTVLSLWMFNGVQDNYPVMNETTFVLLKQSVTQNTQLFVYIYEKITWGTFFLH